jgi:hypothetical protein
MSVLVTLEKWSADYDALFLRRNRADCMMLVPWGIWIISSAAQTTEGEMNADGNVTGRFSCRQRTQVDKIELAFIGVQVFG